MPATLRAALLCLAIFTGAAGAGGVLTLSAEQLRFGGRVTVVAFVSARCPVSNAYGDRLQAIYDGYRGKSVRFLAVNSNFNEAAAEIAENARQHGFTFPVYRDAQGEAAAKLRAEYTPEVFLVDSAGAVRYHGAIDDAQNPARVKHSGLREALDALLAGKAPPQPEIKGFGCTIKRPRTAALEPLGEAHFPELIAAHRTHVLLVDFWATWCEPCREELPALATIAAGMKGKGVDLVTISCDEPAQTAAALEVLRSSGIEGPYFRKDARDDGAWIKAVDPKWSGALPALFLYNRDGLRIKTFTGQTESGAVKAAIQSAL